ncbi:MAG: cytochrome P450 [Pseudomonadota bacterium]
MNVSPLPFLDFSSTGFSTRSREVRAARATSWCAKTPFGYAVLRHREAGLLLRDRRLRQGSHAWPDIIGIQGPFAEFWKRSIISLEGDAHRLLRKIAQGALSDSFVLSMHDDFCAIADELADDLRSKPDFDFVAGFTEPFAGRAIAVLLDQPKSEAADIARDASALGLAMGPDAVQHEAITNAACVRLSQQAERLLKTPPVAGYVPRLLSQAKELGLDDSLALVDLIVISIFGGVDTTRAQLAFAIHLFAEHKDQWQWLRNHPDHVRAALDEVIRTRPTTTWSTREALEDFDFGGVRFVTGDTLHFLVHATGTDPLIGSFEGFDIRADRKIHFGFGGGAHHCLGHFMARTDMTAALSVLLRRWRSINLVGTPEFLPDSGNTSPRTLRIAPDWEN